VALGDGIELLDHVVCRATQAVLHFLAGRRRAHNILLRRERHAHEVDKIAGQHQTPAPAFCDMLAVMVEKRRELRVDGGVLQEPRRTRPWAHVRNDIRTQVHVGQQQVVEACVRLGDGVYHALRLPRSAPESHALARPMTQP
jgi:hypothetical protein